VVGGSYDWPETGFEDLNAKHGGFCAALPPSRLPGRLAGQIGESGLYDPSYPFRHQPILVFFLLVDLTRQSIAQQTLHAPRRVAKGTLKGCDERTDA
jgi:hypothetical protein